MLRETTGPGDRVDTAEDKRAVSWRSSFAWCLHNEQRGGVHEHGCRAEGPMEAARSARPREAALGGDATGEAAQRRTGAARCAVIGPRLESWGRWTPRRCLFQMEADEKLPRRFDARRRPASPVIGRRVHGTGGHCNVVIVELALARSPCIGCCLSEQTSQRATGPPVRWRPRWAEQTSGARCSGRPIGNQLLLDSSAADCRLQTSRGLPVRGRAQSFTLAQQCLCPPR
jgi:hypothetical protein